MHKKVNAGFLIKTLGTDLHGNSGFGKAEGVERDRR